MGILAKLFHRKQPEAEGLNPQGQKDKGTLPVGGVEDFMTLLRVYMQSTLATTVGINSPQALPDMMLFKRTLKVPTVNNRLGIGERKACKQLMQSLWGTSENFFKEIDTSVKRNCKRQPDVPQYLYAFQGFSQEVMLLMGNLLKWKFRIPSFLKGLLKKVTDQTVADVFTKQTWKDPATWKSVQAVRDYAKRLGFSQAWTSEFVYGFIILAKRAPRPTNEQIKQAEAKIKK